MFHFKSWKPSQLLPNRAYVLYGGHPVV
jgi:hypothetical protein